MFTTIRKYAYERRRGIATTVGFLGAAYLAGQYVVARLEEYREQVVQDRAARENLRRRFQQNQEDCSFHICALLPTLGRDILEELDVEGVTVQLQQSRATAPLTSGSLRASTELSDSSTSLRQQAPAPQPAQEQETPAAIVPEAPSNVEGQLEAETIVPHVPERAEESASTASEGGQDTEYASALGESSASWVEQFASQQSELSASATEVEGASEMSASILTESDAVVVNPTSSNEASPAAVESQESSPAPPAESPAESSVGSIPVIAPAPAPSKSKAELWKELKILAFTRNLTIIYTLTLLSLQTYTKLNIIGRYKYVKSVYALEREEKRRERHGFGRDMSLGSLFWRNEEAPELHEEAEEVDQDLSDEVERKYLTMSWILLHSGWRDVAGKVRHAVEDVFESVSLKAQVSIADLERLINEVRRRVEFDGSKQVNFIHSMIPLTEAEEQLVLEQGGLPTHQAFVDPALRELLDETKSLLNSPEFYHVLKLCLDKATNILIDGLHRDLFDGDTSRGMKMGESGVVEIVEEKIRLASLLPGVARWSHLALNAMPNELIDGLADVREVAGFSAIIYSSFDDRLR
ncbi:hypothetical protein BOTBODRAFT_58844 [Botryobasidium botryosum FD-172 SS1]|uniref:Peroxin-3 n=1 Tax=Botryobasidium botryosum (strain FD-172 SS1) TaxID=930990 RepID=A0A067M0D7_BOTB1|nr:hypothetical protein BOTBODRAFT_58844 [Botryobasidium botryosum FD-172 SS1]